MDRFYSVSPSRRFCWRSPSNTCPIFKSQTLSRYTILRSDDINNGITIMQLWKLCIKKGFYSMMIKHYFRFPLTRCYIISQYNMHKSYTCFTAYYKCVINVVTLLYRISINMFYYRTFISRFSRVPVKVWLIHRYFMLLYHIFPNYILYICYDKVLRNINDMIDKA